MQVDFLRLNINGQSGFVLPVGDIHGMADKAVELLSNDHLLNLFKNQAYQRALDFDIEKYYPNMRNIIDC